MASFKWFEPSGMLKNVNFWKKSLEKIKNATIFLTDCGIKLPRETDIIYDCKKIQKMTKINQQEKKVKCQI